MEDGGRGIKGDGRGTISLVPVHFCQAVHLDVELSPSVEEVDWYMLVLVACGVPVLPSDLTDGELLSDLVYDIMVGLLRGVISVGKDSSKARFTIAAELYGAMGYVMEAGDGVSDDN